MCIHGVCGHPGGDVGMWGGGFIGKLEMGFTDGGRMEQVWFGGVGAWMGGWVGRWTGMGMALGSMYVCVRVDTKI